MELSNIHERILTYCSEDDMGLWIFARYATDDKYNVFPIKPYPEEAQKKVIMVITELLEAELIEATSYDGSEFIRLQGSNLEIIHYINQEWNNLGRKPSGGDVCWFRATQKGKELTRELGLIA